MLRHDKTTEEDYDRSTGKESEDGMRIGEDWVEDDFLDTDPA